MTVQNKIITLLPLIFLVFQSAAHGKPATSTFKWKGKIPISTTQLTYLKLKDANTKLLSGKASFEEKSGLQLKGIAGPNGKFYILMQPKV
ncbi:hypothetical protein F9L16_17650 [Agarivorans sp. B2Z047]|uniref:hypothetical protein n=1 Tax=Agarivorans sp. B2Z047 TaxID=2652721 RepID=UPI00128E0497|nr:hypothetical protein [Agarivorans sp. B2Z047]MPW30814.1 hypothetical protein [Agarivorans sp. B2Z047]UQN40956.1 hypothetical protein LQZ07_14360 [Agarivorans sp. B2Z047]